jgi:hypothetical protein
MATLLHESQIAWHGRAWRNIPQPRRSSLKELLALIDPKDADKDETGAAFHLLSDCRSLTPLPDLDTGRTV